MKANTQVGHLILVIHLAKEIFH